MKNYNLTIQDKDEKIWDYLIKNKEESNINETLTKLIKQEADRLKKQKGD